MNENQERIQELIDYYLEENEKLDELVEYFPELFSRIIGRSHYQKDQIDQFIEDLEELQDYLD